MSQERQLIGTLIRKINRLSYKGVYSAIARNAVVPTRGFAYVVAAGVKIDEDVLVVGIKAR